MTIRDEQTARVLSDVADELSAVDQHGLAADMRAILKLIATQIEDADRRHTQVLAEMHERLAVMTSEARLTRAKVPAQYAPAFERLQEGIELLAGLIANRELDAAAADWMPGGAMGQSTGEATGEAMLDPAADTGEFGFERPADVFTGVPADDEPAHPGSGLFQIADGLDGMSDEADEDGVITDNAADRFEDDEFTADAAFEAIARRETEFGQAGPRGPTEGDFEASSAPSPHDQDLDAALVGATADEQVRSFDGDTDEPWDTQSAEALAQIYESGEAGFGMPAEVAAQAAARKSAETRGTPVGVSHEAMFAASPGALMAPSAQAVLHASYDAAVEAEADAFAHGPAALAGLGPAVEKAWLEERFTEIALRIEEALAGVRTEDALASLSDRFESFEGRMGAALEDIVRREDIEAIRPADEQFDMLANSFERVETQIGRIDSLEQQVEAILDRLSDDRLMTLFARQAGGVGDSDLAGIADAAAENVAQRFLESFGAERDQSAVVELRESLELFMAERREHDHEAAGMLDTIQQALIRVLDRVEVLESGRQTGLAGYGDDAMQAGDEPDDGEFIAGAGFDEAAGYAALDAEAYGADLIDAAEEATRRPQRADYGQRLEYPAAVRGGEGSAGIPGSLRHDGEPLDDMAPETSDRFGEVSGDADPSPGHSDGAPATDAGLEPAAPASGHYNDADTEIRSYAPGSDGELPQVSAIDRLRQEFIADARRARARAEELVRDQVKRDATQAEKAAQAGRFSVPGLSSLGRKTAAAADEHIQEAPTEIRPNHREVEPSATETGEPRSRFALPRSRLLVGAVIVLFATAGALLMMRDKSPEPIASPPAAIEQPAEPGAATGFQPSGDGPELIGPDGIDPARPGGPATDRQGSIDGMGYIIPSGRADLSNPQLPGVALADLDKAPDLDALARAERHKQLARMSNDLGTAAAYATPAHLMPENAIAGGDQSPVANANASHATHLSLPPATVGPLSLRIAAAKGDPSAQFEVAARLASGSGTDQNLPEAVAWYQRSAAQGFAQAQYRLGTLYERGLGVEKDLARAGIWYLRAAENGSIKAMHNFAVISAGIGTGAGGPDYASAATWFGTAAEYGLSDSQFNMAVLLENGLGVDKDPKKAFVYYALAAKAGDDQAVKRRDALRAVLSPGDLKAAERQVEVFRAKISDKLVNDARVAGEAWKQRADHSF